MNDLRAGAVIRAERRRRRLRQEDVADRAGVAQQSVSRLERGQAGHLTLHTLRAICGAIEIDVELLFRTHGPAPDAMLDARHAALVALVAGALGDDWAVVTEFSFNEYGDRGSIDLLAWHPRLATLLIVEVKTEIDDLQELLRAMDIRERLAPRIVRRSKSWQPRVVGSVLVLPDGAVSRRAVQRHAAIFDRALPARTIEVKRWLREGVGSLRGIWFLSLTPGRSVSRNPGSRGRIRTTSRPSSTLNR